jgi:hypothetical protein
MELALEQVKKQVVPVAKKAGKASDEMIHRVAAIARGIHYDPHPKRSQMLAIIKAVIPVAVIGVMAGRKSAERQ